MIFGEAIPYAEIESNIRIRGCISLFLTVVCIFSFAQRSFVARYAVYFATIFVCVNFFFDVQRIAGSFSDIGSLSSAIFLFLRPPMMFSLMILCYGFNDTIQLERPAFWRKRFNVQLE